jgi:Mg-chelatase subunit ChlD
MQELSTATPSSGPQTMNWDEDGDSRSDWWFFKHDRATTKLVNGEVNQQAAEQMLRRQAGGETFNDNFALSDAEGRRTDVAAGKKKAAGAAGGGALPTGGLAPLPLKVPAPTLKGTPEDLPSGPSVTMGGRFTMDNGIAKQSESKPEPRAAAPGQMQAGQELAKERAKLSETPLRSRYFDSGKMLRDEKAGRQSEVAAQTDSAPTQKEKSSTARSIDIPRTVDGPQRSFGVSAGKPAEAGDPLAKRLPGGRPVGQADAPAAARGVVAGAPFSLLPPPPAAPQAAPVPAATTPVPTSSTEGSSSMGRELNVLAENVSGRGGAERKLEREQVRSGIETRDSLARQNAPVNLDARFADRLEGRRVAEGEWWELHNRGQEKDAKLGAYGFSITTNALFGGGLAGVSTGLPAVQLADESAAVPTDKKKAGDEVAGRQSREAEKQIELGEVAQHIPSQPTPPAVPQPEIETRENAFSTFSLNVTDVSFQLAGASLDQNKFPEAHTIRTEEFINAFDYRDPEPSSEMPVALAWERAAYPFAQGRDLVRFSVKTGARGRESGRPLNLTLVLDNSGSMERADRVQIIQEALQVLAQQLQAHDRVSVITFARTARLWVDAVPGNQAGDILKQVSNLTPEGGTNLEEAMRLGYETARRNYIHKGVNRVVLLTDGAANLGNVEPNALKQLVEQNRKQSIALDCFGIGWEGYNDELLETLTRNGDGRYGFINHPEEAATKFAGQLAGALHVAAADVKVQVEWNPTRVTAFRQLGYAKHQLTKEQFRDNTVDAAELGAAEAGNALYVVQVNPQGEGPLGTLRVRYRVPDTGEYQEHSWALDYTGPADRLEQASPALKLAGVAAAFSEWLASNPYAGEVTPDRLLNLLRGVPEHYQLDPRPKRLEWMIRQAKAISGK